MRKITLKFQLFLSVLFLVAACTDPKKTNVYDEANALMDRGAYGQAIALLEPELEKAPGDQQLRVLLAAAYSGRAGIVMRDYLDLAKEITQTARAAENFLASRQAQGIQKLKNKARDPERKRSLQFVESVYKVAMRLNNFVIAFDVIPTPANESGIKDLNTAISILDEDQTLTGGRALYRGLLRISLLKLNLKDKYDVDYLADCDISIKRLRWQFESLQLELNEIFNDLVLGTLKPKSQAKILDLSRNFNAEINKVLDLIDTLGVEQSEAALLSVQAQLLGKCE